MIHWQSVQDEAACCMIFANEVILVDEKINILEDKLKHWKLKNKI